MLTGAGEPFIKVALKAVWRTQDLARSHGDAALIPTWATGVHASNELREARLGHCGKVARDAQILVEIDPGIGGHAKIGYSRDARIKVPTIRAGQFVARSAKRTMATRAAPNHARTVRPIRASNQHQTKAAVL